MLQMGGRGYGLPPTERKGIDMNGAFHYTFQRTEKKYLLTQPVFEQFFRAD